MITDKSSKRLVYLSSVVTGVTALSLPCIILAMYLGYMEGSVPTTLKQLYYIAVFLSYLYIVGPETYKEYTNIKKGKE